MSFPERLLAGLREAAHVVVFTGAGVSAESGIPTFRDALTGLWENFDAQELATLEAFHRQKDLIWGWYEVRRTGVLRTQPNAAHQTIARMAARVPLVTVVTQNVDDLHERAGSTGVLHLHGSLHEPRCVDCARPHALPPDDIDAIPGDGERRMPPKCVHCGGWIRPGVVWFGEMLPPDIWEAAIQASHSCDVFLSVGTSSVVYPAAGLPFEAKKGGAYVVQLNPQPTPLDEVADCNLVGKAGEVLPLLYAETWGDDETG